MSAFGRNKRNRQLQRLRGSRWYPFLMIALTAATLVLCWIILFQLVVPLVKSLLGNKIQELPMASGQQQVEDFSGRIREVLLTNKFKYVGKPTMLGDDVYFSSGQDNFYNPLMKEIYVAKSETANAQNPTQIEGIEAEGDIVSLAVNAEYIVYFDSNKTGGGTIYAYTRQTKTTEKLKEVLFGTPEVFLTGPYAVWMERTGPKEDRLFMMNVVTKEYTTLAAFTDNLLGACLPGVSDKSIVWVEPDPDNPDSTQYNVIKIQSLGEDAAAVKTYTPGMYACNPMTNGSAIVWSDNFGGKDANLYLTMEGSMPKKLAENVSGYGVAERFVAYCQYGRIYIYNLSTGALGQLTKSTEYALLGTVSAHGVTWFDITDERRERDILKFAVLD